MPTINEFLKEPEEVSEEENEQITLDGKTSHDIIEDKYADMLMDLEEGDELDRPELSEEEESEETEEETVEGEESEEEVVAEEEEETEEEVVDERYGEVRTRLAEGLGKEFESDEDVTSAIDSLLDYKNKYETDAEAFETITSLMEGSEEVLEAAKLVRERGLTFNQAIATVLDFEALQEDLKDSNPKEYKDIVRRQVELQDKKKKERKARQEQQEQFEANQKESASNWNEFVKENDLKKEEKEALANQISGITENLLEAKAPKELIALIHRGMNYEKAIAEAEERGMVKGKNAKIDSEHRRRKGDGIVDLSGGPSRTAGVEEKGEDIFDVALKPKKRIADY